MADKFKLQHVLDHRQRLENIAQQKLADSLLRETALQHQLARQRTELDKLRQELTDRQKSGINIQQLQLFNLSIHRQRKKLQDLLNQIMDIHQEVISHRKLLAEAAQEKKLLENLKEKKEAEQKFQEKRREAGVLDDIALRLGKYSL